MASRAGGFLDTGDRLLYTAMEKPYTSQDDPTRAISRRTYLKAAGVSAIVAGTGSTVVGASGHVSPFEATIDCTVFKPARITVTNVSDETWELRDIDSAGVNAVNGRPVLDPGESYSKPNVPNGTAVLQAYDPDTGDPVGPRLKVEVDCDPDYPLKVTTSCARNGGVVSIMNTSSKQVQVRDIDRHGGDLLSGRPRLDPGETMEITGVADDTYVVRAFRNNSPAGPAIEVVVDCD
jgi:hypothetical protein